VFSGHLLGRGLDGVEVTVAGGDHQLSRQLPGLHGMLTNKRTERKRSRFCGARHCASRGPVTGARAFGEKVVHPILGLRSVHPPLLSSEASSAANFGMECRTGCFPRPISVAFRHWPATDRVMHRLGMQSSVLSIGFPHPSRQQRRETVLIGRFWHPGMQRRSVSCRLPTGCCLRAAHHEVVAPVTRWTAHRSRAAPWPPVGEGESPACDGRRKHTLLGFGTVIIWPRCAGGRRGVVASSCAATEFISMSGAVSVRAHGEGRLTGHLCSRRVEVQAGHANSSARLVVLDLLIGISPGSA
jgi:hypothetical protein